MKETHANYSQFMNLVKKADILNQEELETLYTQKVQDIFSIDVDHPMGYEDGLSNTNHNLMLDYKMRFTEKERSKLIKIAEKMIKPSFLKEYSPEEKRDFLLGTNQLSQISNFHTSRWDKENKRSRGVLEKIIRTYNKSSAPVLEWEAQKAENRGFYHVSQMNNAIYLTMISNLGVAAAGAIGAILLVSQGGVIPPVISKLAEYWSLPMVALSVLSHGVDQALLLPLQDIGKSPTDPDAGLIKSKHFRFVRHPLYGGRMLSSMFMGLICPNPISLYYTLKSFYHGGKACQEQDKRMKILYGKEAEEYQEKTPSFIPGTKSLMRGLKRILPEKVVDTLNTPLCDQLGKISWIRKESRFLEGLDGFYDENKHKGGPTQYRWIKEKSKQ